MKTHNNNHLVLCCCLAKTRQTTACNIHGIPPEFRMDFVA